MARNGYRSGTMTDIRSGERSDERGEAEEPEDSEPVIAAIDELQASLSRNLEDERTLSAELAQLRRARLAGRSWRQALGADGPTPALSVLGRVLRRLSEAGGTFRRSLAVALVAEGDQLSDVAGRFGVSRQRVYSLVRKNGPAGSRPGSR